MFDRVDRAGDVVRVGAFGAVAPVPLLFAHRGDPVGAIETLAVDARGLRVSGRVTDAALAAAVRQGALAGLSIGYRPLAVRQGAWRELLRVALVEVSLVPVPMLRLARIDRVE